MKSRASAWTGFLLTLLVSPVVLSASGNGTPFAVKGEQLEYAVPSGWKLAWMDGNGDGPFLAEYIPQGEDIHTWREGYFLVQRLPYPPANARAELEKAGTRLADVALRLYMTKLQEACGGHHTAMSQRTNTFNGVYMAVSGGFCDRYGPAAPYGEGGVVAFAEGKNSLFRVQYGWRPKTAEEQGANRPWRTAPQTIEKYLEAFKAISLCGDEDEAVCKRDYLAGSVP